MLAKQIASFSRRALAQMVKQDSGDSFGVAPRRTEFDVEDVGDVSVELAATAAALISDFERLAPGASVPSGDITCISSCPSAPRWTIPGRHSTGSIKKADGPGPKYKIDMPRSSQGPRFGTKTAGSSSGRILVIPSESPGPAQYDTIGAKPKHIRGGAVGQDNRTRSPTKVNTPGPGSYANHSTLNQGGTAMGQAPLKRGFNGPSSDSPEARRGFYTTKRPTSAPPSWSFGTGKRMGHRDVAGDPPLYNPPSTLSGKSSASCRNGAVPPDSSAFEVRPDPTTYCAEKPDCPLAQSFPRAARPMSAGPGAVASTKVGPGSYPNSSAAHISTLSALVCSTKIASPTKSRPQSGHAESAPGPGAYSDVLPRRKQIAFGFGRASRDPGPPRPRDIGPGPGSYGGPSGPNRPSSSSSRLGPRLPSRKDASSGSTRSRASPAPDSEQAPGPGAHDPVPVASPLHHSGWTFGTSGRTASRQKLEPGPGAYNPAPLGGAMNTSAPRFTQSQIERSADLSASGLGPGPGAYKAYSTFV